MSKFQEKIVLITGGANGIGFRMGKRALARGARHLIIWDINAKQLSLAEKELHQASGKVHAMQVDVSNPEEVQSAAAHVLSTLGCPDILINNAGIVIGKPFHEHSFSDVQKTISVNQLAFMYVTLAFLPGMMERNCGHIVAITSAAGLTPNPGMVAYASSKWGAVGWIESLRVELQKSHPGIKTLNVMPSYIDTGMFNGVTPPRFIPILDPEKISDKIITAIERDKARLMAPFMVKTTNFFKGVLPFRVYDYVASRLFNVYSSMNTFKGRTDE